MAQVVAAAVCTEQAQHGPVDGRALVRVIDGGVKDGRGGPVAVEAQERQAQGDRVAAIHRCERHKALDIDAVGEVLTQRGFALCSQGQGDVDRRCAVGAQRDGTGRSHGHLVCAQLAGALGEIGLAVFRYGVFGQHGHANFIFDLTAAQVIGLEREGEAAVRAAAQLGLGQAALCRGQVGFRLGGAAKLDQTGTLLAGGVGQTAFIFHRHSRTHEQLVGEGCALAQC